MKIILTIFCVLAALFGGGCAMMLIGSAGPISILPLAILVFNGLILYGLWSANSAWRPAFYILGAVDLLIAVVGLFLMGSGGIRLSGPDGILLLLPLAFAAKGILTLVYARRV